MSDVDTDHQAPENFGVSALASALVELCDLAASGTPDTLGRCDAIIERFEEQTLDRRHRASSMSALQLAIRNRMPAGPAKTHIQQRLDERLERLKREGRFEGAANRRASFS